MIADNKRLLETGECSDFTIRCQEKKWKVNRFIICGRFEALAKMCKGSFQILSLTRCLDSTDASLSQEAATGSTVWGGHNPAVVEQFLRYLYTLYYDDAKVPALRDPFFEEPPPATDAGSETSQPENRSSAQGSTGRTIGSGEARHDYHANADDQQVARHHRLIISMSVYAMADMYQIPALMQLALSKFGTCAATWPHGAFPAIIQRMLVLTGLEDKGLRRLCANICAEHLYEIVVVTRRNGRIGQMGQHDPRQSEVRNSCLATGRLLSF